MAQVVPNCLICNAQGKLVICYQCNAIATYSYADIMDRQSPKICMGCNNPLLDPPPPKCQIHACLVQDANGTIRCQDCRTIFTEASNQMNQANQITSTATSDSPIVKKMRHRKKECG